jgi:hypothetical protein
MDIRRPQQESLAELVDRIVELRHSLLPTCQDPSALPPAERCIIVNVCETLHSVTAELIEILKPVAAAGLSTQHSSFRNSLEG